MLGTASSAPEVEICGSHTGTESAALVILAVTCRGEPWLPKRLPCGTAAGVDVC